MRHERRSHPPLGSSRAPRFPSVPDPVEHLRLSDSRHIPFLDLGDPSGFPVIYHHGWPSSAWQAALAHRCALELGIRIIAPDRSRFRPHRNPGSVSDVADDIIELIQELNIPECSHLGVSGGAPYALSTVSKAPDQTHRAILCSGMVHPGPQCIRLLFRPYRILASIQRHSPRLLKWTLRFAFGCLRSTPESGLMKLLLRVLSRPDRAALQDPDTLATVERAIRQAIYPDSQGIIQDGIRLTTPWKFQAQIRQLPVWIAHGQLDHVIPVSVPVTAYPDVDPSRFRVYPEEGHYSLPIRHMKDLLQSLMH